MGKQEMMSGMKKTGLAILVLLGFQGCSHVDDYILGKDNTPKPQELTTLASSKYAIKTDWSVPVAKSSRATNAYLKLKPVIKNGVVYVVNPNGTVYAIEQQTGRVRWSKTLKPGLLAGPVVSEETLALTADNSSLILLRLTDGQEMWHANLSGDALGKPAVARQKVIVKTIDGNVYAFHLATGERVWYYDHGAPSLILKASSSPVIVGNKVALVGFSDGKLDALDLLTGKLVWQRSIAFPSGASDVERLVDIDADPIAQDNKVYFAGYQGHVGALSLADGQFIWRKPASTYKNLTMSANVLYMTDSQDILWAFNKHNGQVIWKQTALQARKVTEPVLMDGQVVVGDATGYLHVLSGQSGELLARAQVNGGIRVAPVVSGRAIYVMTDNGTFNRFSVSK